MKLSMKNFLHFCDFSIMHLFSRPMYGPMKSTDLRRGLFFLPAY